MDKVQKKVHFRMLPENIQNRIKKNENRNPDLMNTNLGEARRSSDSTTSFPIECNQLKIHV